MPEKRSPPLENPPSEKAVVVVAGIKFKLITFDSNDSKIEKGVSKGGKGRGKIIEAIVMCQMCRHEQKIVSGIVKPPEWHRCTWCGELQPMDGYDVVAYGRGLPRVLAPHEVKSRAGNLGY